MCVNVTLNGLALIVHFVLALVTLRGSVVLSMPIMPTLGRSAPTRELAIASLVLASASPVTMVLRASVPFALTTATIAELAGLRRS